MALHLHVAPGLGEQQKEEREKATVQDREKASVTQEEKPAFETTNVSFKLSQKLYRKFQGLKKPLR